MEDIREVWVEEGRVRISSDVDILTARQKGRELAQRLGFSPLERTMIATAVSELARNILLYAREGEVVLRSLEERDRCGIQVVARDQGPGIPDVNLATMVGYSTSGGLGLGLSMVKRTMDELTIVSTPGQGTVVTATKWKLLHPEGSQPGSTSYA